MSIRINFEIGHEAAIRSKRTIDGFTHDWEVFVKGCENADIQYFIDKVVFHLHETFPNPKRVIKDPPYRVRESGYAGFNLPIDIYLRNNEEPKKIRFNYDLNLQTTGPAIYKVQKEKYVFCNPTEEFRHKLMKGGGVVSIPSSSENSRDVSTSNDKQHLVNKAKSTISATSSAGEPAKKYRKEHKADDSFTDLFGTPITKTSKVSPDAKLQQSKTSPTNNPTSILKADKLSNPKKSKSKHSPKDKERDKEKKDKSQDKKHKDEKKNKDRSNKDKERKDKTVKREKSPKLQAPASPIRSPKRPGSPKRIPSPKRPPSPPIKMKAEEKKVVDEPAVQQQHHQQHQHQQQQPPPPPKTEKIKQDLKKSKNESKDKEKEKKEYKSHKEKDPVIRTTEPKEHKSATKEPKPIKDPNVVVNKVKEKAMKAPEEPTAIREVEKIMDKPKIDKTTEAADKPKHKHKKKDSKEKREKKEEKSKEKKEEKKKADKEKEKTETYFEKVYKEQVKHSPKENDKSSIDPKMGEAIGERSGPKEKSRALDALQAELQPDESTDSSIVTHDESSIEIAAKATLPLLDKADKKKEKLGKSEATSEKKRKRKHETAVKEEASAKVVEGAPKIARVELPEFAAKAKDKNNGTEEEEDEEEGVVAMAMAMPQDYMSILKELQHKIMTLQDNNELQRVVQLIAETGHYEITAQTFDFDLCALDRDTVRRLQEFFAVS